MPLNTYQMMHDHIKALAHKTYGAEIDLSKLTCEPPRDPSHGDMATNVAMILTKQLGRPARDIADEVCVGLANLSEIAHVATAGPGFINITLQPGLYFDTLRHILRVNGQWGTSNIGRGESMMVEYVSANPTGPMHIGHCRGAILGDSIANLFKKVGYNVHREFYVNDAGGQVAELAKSLYQRYLQALDPAYSPVFTEGMYPGDYLVAPAKALAAEVGDRYKGQPQDAWIEEFRTRAVAAMLNLIKADLARLKVFHDEFFSERTLVQARAVDQAIQTLQEKGAIYQGILEKPKGHDADDWEPREQLLFRSTAYGDDNDRPIQKSDGSWTYFANDIAYHFNKVQRGYKHLVNIFGADHAGYLTRLKSAVKALTDGKVSLDIKVNQLVNFFENGQVVKMSKRGGTFVTVEDVVERVGVNAARFMMLTRSNEVLIDFDFKKVLEHSKDNPVFYVQYAHARIQSVLRHAEEQGFAPDCSIDLACLMDPDELALIKLLSQWPRQVAVAAQMLEPHRITTYLHDVAAAFHALWNKGRDQAQLRFILPDQPTVTQARLVLIKAVALTIASGLEILGIEPAMEM